jgi:hypothetical protein
MKVFIFMPSSMFFHCACEFSISPRIDAHMYSRCPNGIGRAGNDGRRPEREGEAIRP